MKQLFTLLLLVCGMSISMAQCTYTIDLADSFGDGWNGASIDVRINGTFFNNYTLANGFTGNVTFAANNLDLVEFTYNSGTFDNEVSYTISQGGVALFNDGPNPTTGLVFSNVCGGCDPVGNVTATNVTTTSAQLNWAVAGGSPTAWLVEYGPAGFGVGTGTVINAPTNPYTFMGLMPGTVYEVYISSICSSGDTSLATGPLAFTTPCLAIATFPYQEGFNSFSPTEPCWLVLNQNGDNIAWDMNNTFNPFEGDEAAAINTDFNFGANDDYLISPQLTLTGGERMRFKHRCNSTFEPNDFQVVLSTTGRDAADFTNVLLTDTSELTTYEEVIVDLSAYSGNVYIGFKIPPGGLDGWILYIDDVLFERPTQNDAGVVALRQPQAPVANGFSAFEVDVRNYGLAPLSSFTVEWTVNGVPQNPVAYVGQPLANSEIGRVYLGNINVPATDLDLEFWTVLPNGLPDEESSNDTLERKICAGLSGVYTVGHPTADFPQAEDAFRALRECGVSGPVTMEFIAGTYAGPWKFGRIPGASAVNTVILDGLDASTTTVTYNTGTEGLATVVFEGTEYLTIRNFTIENTGVNGAYGVLLTNQANYNTIDQNTILVAVNATSTNTVGILASASPTQSTGLQTEGNNANWTLISNNDIAGGEVSILLEGGERDSVNVGNQIVNNELHDAQDYGIFADEQDRIMVSGNRIYDLLTGFATGVELFDASNFAIMGNEIDASDRGIRTVGGFNDPCVNGRIVNNIVQAGDEALFLQTNTAIEVFHNTFSGGARTVYFDNQLDIDFRSNIMETQSGACFFTFDAVSMRAMDYNLYYLNGGGNAVRFGTTTYATLANWQANGPAGYDANALSGNPNFTAGLRLGGPLAVDAGDPSLSIPQDIDGDVRPLGGAPDMGADEYVVIADDAQAFALISPDGCGNPMADVVIEVVNKGANTLSNIPVTVNVTGAGLGAFTATLPLLPAGGSAQLNMGTLNTAAGGTFDFEIILGASADTNPANDTLRVSRTILPDNVNALTFTGDNLVCVGNTAQVSATASYSPATIVWYDAATGGNIINVGPSFTTAPLTANVTYYAEVQGCNSPRAIRPVTVDVVGIDVDLGADETICGGADLTLIPIVTNATATSLVWSNGALTDSIVVTASGQYTVTVMNANGCMDTDTIQVTATPAPSIAPALTNVACGGDANGAIDLTVTGGTGPYTYQWSNSATTEDVSGLSGGYYVVTVTDNGTASSCSYIETYFLTEPTALTATLNNTTIACDGNNGTVDVNTAGGTAPYTYLWSNNATTEDLNGVSGGVYTVTATDANGCATTTSATVTAANPITVNIDSIYPEILAIQGGIDITATGGTGNFQYAWNTGATTDDVSGLVAGTYTVTVTDLTTGCQVVITNIVVPYQLPDMVDQLSSVERFQLYPNPTNGTLWINLELAKTESVELSIMSVTGKLLQQYEPNEQLEQTYEVDMSQYPAGVYLARLIVGNQVRTVKVIVE